MQDPRPDPTLDLEYRAQRPIFTDFLEHARQSPDAIAVIARDATCSYGQLEQVSQGIAAFLIGQGATASDRVVIVSGRCAGLVYAMLGALRAGLTFTVADVAYPPARVAQIIRALQPAYVLLCGEAVVDLNPGHLQSTPPRVVRIPEIPAGVLQAFPDVQSVLPEVDPRAPAYVTFTSGSTGEPKGIVTNHAPLVHFIEWHTRRHSFTRDDRFSLLSGLGHDPVYRDVFTPLSLGAAVNIPAQSVVIDPAALAKWINESAISVIHLTPPLGKLIETGAKFNGLQFNALRFFFWGGDALSSTLYEQIRVIAPNAVSVNFYGTTETPQAMAFHQVDPHANNARIPLGKGIEGAQLLVVNDSNQLVGEGDAGEILIRSPYLSLGYWNDKAQTNEKFVENPFTHVADDLCYKTGDLGTYLSDGSVLFLGRGDSQVKIRGHRIELSEIEVAVSRHSRIKQCVVSSVVDSSPVRLVAYCVATTPVTSLELREHVSRELPDYMVPALFVFVDAIPLTPNGKIDRRALPPINLEATSSNLSQDLSPVVAKLAAAWADILEVPHIDAHLSFVELGGDSLSFVQASMVLEELIGPLPAQWETIPVRELGERTKEAASSMFSLRAMEFPVLLRVMSILLIVIGHLQLFTDWPIAGETTVLFIVSGISLARFQLQIITERGSVHTLLKSIVTIAVPTLLYALLVQIVFDRVHWQTVLFVSNWFPESVVGYFNYWYIEVLLQMIAIIGIALSFERVRKTLMTNPFRNLVIASCVLAVADLVINPYVFDADTLYNRVPQHFLSIMVLGMAIHYANSTTRKWVASVVTVAVLGGQDLLLIYGNGAPGVDISQYVDIAMPAVLAVIWIRSVPVPGLIARGLALIASSTLYIYLTHYQFQSLARHIIEQPVVAVMFAIVGGIGVAYAWNKAVRVVLMRWNKGRKKTATETVERVA